MIDDGEVRCGACEKLLPIEQDVFLCRACMDRLPGNLRHDVLNVEEAYQYAARRHALEALGVELIDHAEHSNTNRRSLKPSEYSLTSSASTSSSREKDNRRDADAPSRC